LTAADPMPIRDNAGRGEGPWSVCAGAAWRVMRNMAAPRDRAQRQPGAERERERERERRRGGSRGRTLPLRRKPATVDRGVFRPPGDE
jgi:hypothetical protein